MNKTEPIDAETLLAIPLPPVRWLIPGPPPAVLCIYYLISRGIRPQIIRNFFCQIPLDRAPITTTPSYLEAYIFQTLQTLVHLGQHSIPNEVQPKLKEVP